MSFSDIIGHKDICRTLMTALQNSKVGHAYLFVGPAGVGKKTIAKELAAKLLCQNPTEFGQCDCSSCRSLTASCHPEFVSVVPVGNSIKIEQLRELQHIAYLRPLLGERKVFYIPDAEQLTEAAANSFLKILEEPPRGIVFIFTAVRVDHILPTIRSRCQVINLFPVAPDEIAAWLRGKGIEAGEAQLRAKACQGSPGIAIKQDEAESTQGLALIEILAQDLLKRLKIATEFEKKDRRETVERLHDWEVQARNMVIQHHLMANTAELLNLVRVLEKLSKTIQMVESNVNVRLAVEEFLISAELS